MLSQDNGLSADYECLETTRGQRAELKAVLKLRAKYQDPPFHHSLARSCCGWLRDSLVTADLLHNGRTVKDGSVHDQCFVVTDVITWLTEASGGLDDRIGALELLTILRDYQFVKACLESSAGEALVDDESLLKFDDSFDTQPYVGPQCSIQSPQEPTQDSESVGVVGGVVGNENGVWNADIVSGRYPFQCIMAYHIASAIWPKDGEKGANEKAYGFQRQQIFNVLIANDTRLTVGRATNLLNRLRLLGIVQVKADLKKADGPPGENFTWVLSSPSRMKAEIAKLRAPPRTSSKRVPPVSTKPKDNTLLAMTTVLYEEWMNYDLSLTINAEFCGNDIRGWSEDTENEFVPNTLDALCLMSYLCMQNMLLYMHGKDRAFTWDESMYMFNPVVLQASELSESRQNGSTDYATCRRPASGSSGPQSWKSNVRRSARSMSKALTSRGSGGSLSSVSQGQSAESTVPQPQRTSGGSQRNIMRSRLRFRRSTDPTIQVAVGSSSAPPTDGKDHSAGSSSAGGSGSGPLLSFGSSRRRSSVASACSSSSEGNILDADIVSMDSEFSTDDVSFTAMVQSDTSQAAEFLYRQLSSNGLIKVHRHKLRKINNCFTSSDVLNWFANAGQQLIRQEAVAAMKKIQQEGFFVNVTDSAKPFEDDGMLYTFTSRLKEDTETLKNLSKIRRQLSFLNRKEAGSSNGSTKQRQSLAKELPPWCCPNVLTSEIQQLDPVLHRSAAICFCYWLHMELHSRNMVRNRRWGLDTTVYPTCFIAKEAVTFLATSRTVASREDAVCFVEVLRDYNFLHHVVKEHHFKDEFLFFRFRCDESSESPGKVKGNDVTALHNYVNFMQSQEASLASTVCTFDVQVTIGTQLLTLANDKCNPMDMDSPETFFYENDFIAAFLETHPTSTRDQVRQLLQRLKTYGLINMHLEANGSKRNDQSSMCGAESAFSFSNHCTMPTTVQQQDRRVSLPEIQELSDHMACFNPSELAGDVLGMCHGANLAKMDMDSEEVLSFKAADIIQCLVLSDMGMSTVEEAVGIMQLLQQHSLVLPVNESAASVPFTASDVLYAFRNDIQSRTYDSQCSYTGAPIEESVDSNPSSLPAIGSYLADPNSVINDLPLLIPAPGGTVNVPPSEIALMATALHLKWKADKIIKDRRYKLKVYPQCFIGKEVVDWLINEGYAPNRRDSLAIMRTMEKENLISHVCSDHPFRDEFLFFHFASHATRSGSTTPARSSGCARGSIDSFNSTPFRSSICKKESVESNSSTHSVHSASNHITVRLHPNLTRSSSCASITSDSSSLSVNVLKLDSATGLHGRGSEHSGLDEHTPSVVSSILNCSDCTSMVSLKGMASSDEVSRLTEYVRIQLHNSEVVRCIRQGIHYYRTSFLAREAVDWLVQNKHASSRSDATKIMATMCCEGLIHHVHQRQEFADDNSVFRFKKDTASSSDKGAPTRQLTHEQTLGESTCDLYQRLCLHSSAILRTHIHLGRSYKSCITGSELVNYLVRFHEDFINQRPEAVAFCRDLYQQGVICHVHGYQTFKDSNTHFFFTMDPEWRDGPLKSFRKRSTGNSLASDSSMSSTPDGPSGSRSSVGSSNGILLPMMENTSLLPGFVPQLPSPTEERIGELMVDKVVVYESPRHFQNALSQPIALDVGSYSSSPDDENDSIYAKPSLPLVNNVPVITSNPTFDIIQPPEDIDVCGYLRPSEMQELFWGQNTTAEDASGIEGCLLTADDCEPGYMSVSKNLVS